MPATATSPKNSRVPHPELDLEGELAQLAQAILDYARNARVERFRYCRRPEQVSSPHPTLAHAVYSLASELRDAQKRPVCQTRAIDLLRDLAALGHQPPCKTKAEQAAAARLVDTALLELR